MAIFYHLINFWPLEKIVITKSGLLAGIRGSYLEFPDNFIHIILQNRFVLWMYPLIVRSNFNSLLNSLWNTFPISSCFVLFSLCTSFLYSLIIIIIIIISLEFFTSALADGLSLEFEWQQGSSSFLDFSQYSGRSQLRCCLVGLHSSFNFQVLQSLL